MVRVVVQDTIRNRQWVGYDADTGFSVGRGAETSVPLEDSRFVSRRHFFVERSEEGWTLAVDPMATPVVVDGVSVEPGSRQDLRPVSEVRLAEFVLTLLQDDGEELSAEQAAMEDLNSLQRELHNAVLRKLDLRREGEAGVDASPERLETINTFVDELLHDEFHERVIQSASTRQRLMTQAFEGRLNQLLAGQTDAPKDFEHIETPGLNAALEENVSSLTRRLARRIGIEGTRESQAADLELFEEGLEVHAPDVIAQTPDNIQFYLISRSIKKVVCDMVFGLGPLQDLLDTPSITEIMIVSPELVYVERAGQVVRSNRTFLGDSALMSVIERIVAPLGRRIDRSQPLVDARLSDGSRVNAIVPPLALKGPCLTIRRFPATRITAENLVEWGSMTTQAHAILEAAVKSRKNMIVAGGTGSGKTTLLNVLSSFIPETERLVTIEDSAELRLDQEHVVSLETRPANVEGTGAYSIRDLVKNALRMRPDRVIVGECRGEEAFDMLQAMNTGHDGSMTTIHANSSVDVVARVETMCLMAVEIPVSAIRRQVTQAVDMIVFIRRRDDGQRLIEQITEITGMHPDTGEVEMRDLMASVDIEGRGVLRATGYMPSFLPLAVDRGLIDLDRWFGQEQP